MGEDIQKAYELFREHLPKEVEFKIEETDRKLKARYLYRATYTSKTSHRKMTITSKSDNLPKTYNDLRMHLVVLRLSPEEQAKRFSIIAWHERRLRTIAALNGDRTVKVATKENRKDYLRYAG